MFAIVACVLPFFATYSYFVLWPGTDTTQSIYSISKVIQFGLPLVVWLYRGWLPQKSIKNILSECRKQINLNHLKHAIGFTLVLIFLWAVLYIPLLRDTFRASGIRAEVIDKIAEFGVTNMWQYFVLAFFISFIHSFLEEYYWRKFVFIELQKHMKLGSAVWLAAIAFTLHHIIVINKYANIEPKWLFLSLGTLAVFICGLVWTYQYHKTQKMWVTWASHIVADLIVLSIGFDLVYL
jgi:uncharacterized protein